jgi:glycerol-3-phosphate responsive antiterminator
MIRRNNLVIMCSNGIVTTNERAATNNKLQIDKRITCIQRFFHQMTDKVTLHNKTDTARERLVE